MIESPKNERVKEWRRLQTRKGRHETGLFLIEGRHLVDEALRSGADVRELIAETTQEKLPAFQPTTLVSRRVMEAFCEADTPQGIAAIVALPAQIASARPGQWLLLDGVQDPGNVGTMIRTADAAGLSGVVLGEGTADAWGAKALRATQGSIFHLSVISAPVEEWIGSLRTFEVAVYGTGAAAGAINYRDLPLREGASFGLVMGNEGAGVRPEILAQCDVCLRIPMRGQAESLSVAVAAGILLFDLISK